MTSMAAGGSEDRGAVFTRREVVDFILDLSDYTAHKPLHRCRLLEPSMGHGDFIIPAIERLLVAYERDIPTKRRQIVADLGDCFRAVELHKSSYDETRRLVENALRDKGLLEADIVALCDQWLIHGDFLLVDFSMEFTHIVGNPPYIRQELIPDVLMAEYRRRYRTIYDRADIYIPFIERSLTLLAEGGALGFICADRWIKNRYGGPLRQYIAERFHLKYFVDMVDTEAFMSDVIAYPAIIVVGHENSGPTRVSFRPAISATALQNLSQAMTTQKLGKNTDVIEISDVTNGPQPWMLEASPHLSLLRRLEKAYPTIEEAGCKVGIGVATGADQVFIAPYDALDVEPDRKLRLAMTRDILTGTVRWQGLGVINPFGPDGKLVTLTKYPKLAAYLEEHRATIMARHVSKKNPGAWYRTIDRIYPELATVPKLLIPDIKGEAHIVYEQGNLYPHHNLYFVTSSTWDLYALQAVLLSDVTRLFIGLYSTRMRGGYLRFQAQYLRRLRLPHWRNVPPSLQQALKAAGEARDQTACNAASAALYQLTPNEFASLSQRTGISDAA